MTPPESPSWWFSKWKKNQIFRAVEEAGLDPKEFDLEDRDAEVRIKHKRSESYFNIGGDPRRYIGSYVAGDSPAWPYDAYSPESLIRRVKAWLADVKLDLETPDLWAELSGPSISRLRAGRAEEFEPTGWARVDRTVRELGDRLTSATTEEQFQAIGLFCREALISAAQSVYMATRHPPLDDVAVSPTDAKRMLESFITVELAGGANDEARKHARSALDLAVNLQHKRTAAFREAAMCVEATTSVINIVAIVSGRRDPQ